MENLQGLRWKLHLHLWLVLLCHGTKVWCCCHRDVSFFVQFSQPISQVVHLKDKWSRSRQILTKIKLSFNICITGEMSVPWKVADWWTARWLTSFYGKEDDKKQIFSCWWSFSIYWAIHLPRNDERQDMIYHSYSLSSTCIKSRLFATDFLVMLQASICQVGLFSELMS